MTTTTETDRFGFTIAHDLDAILKAMQQGDTMIHIHLPCGHNWVLPAELARDRMMTKQCPICEAAKNQTHAARI